MPDHAAAANSSMLAAKNTVTARSSRCAVEAAAHDGVQRDQQHQHQCRHRDGVGAHLGRELGQHEGLAQRLHDLVGEQQQEGVQHEQERAAALAGPHAREQRQQAFEGTQARACR